MATAKFSMRKQTKSISLPSRSHPTTIEIEEQLDKIKIAVAEAASPEAICTSLSELTRLYKCMDNLLTSSTTQALMSRERNKKWVDELVDESVSFLDICGKFGEMMSEMKAHCRDLLCALRRRKGEYSNVENSIMKYICFRKKMKKDVKVLVGSLKQVDNMVIGGRSVIVDSDNHQLIALVKVSIGVSEITVSVFESLLMFVSVPVVKQNRWSLVVSKLTHKRTKVCEDQQEKVIVNEFESIDDVLRILCKTGLSSEVGNLHIAECRLERLCDCIEWMESELESNFRCLVQTRVTLLNIISSPC